MSQYVPNIHMPIHSRRLALLVSVFVLAVIATATIVLVSGGDDATSSSSPVTQSVGGPNESARGNATASSAGATSPSTGGPDEGARGQAASSASR